jgi:hypothetical protein
MQMSRWPRTKGVRGWPISTLFGHLIVTTAAFVTLFTLNWIASLLFNYLNSIYPFQPVISRLIANLEVELFYVDSVVCAGALFTGVIRMLLGSLEGG